ncbi:MAG: GIY-YIG nuclease family protein [Acidobacteria bacterium]|nr:GIY-YIG nuclease family protein [Acidobacteriota bacterium]MCB9397844.1 GIY-YIG nuclease family protein [Acidobacteriota bacterium]
MYSDAFGRNWQGPYAFAADQISDHAPDGFGVYQVLFNGFGETQVVYIGIATGDTIRGRLRKHCTGSGNASLARRQASGYQFIFYSCDPTTAKQIESHIVTLHKPPYNTRSEHKHFIPSIAVH